MKMRKKVYRARVALVFILIILITLPVFSNAAPPVCGDGSCHPSESCSSCSADCGACPPSGGGGGGTTTTTTTTTGGGGVTSVTVSIETPEDGETIKRGVLTIVVKGYRGTNPETDMIVTATSDLFGEISLVNNFEQRGSGVYGTNVTINKDVKKGNYVILVHGRRESAVDEHQILVNLNPTITVDASVKNSYLKGDRIFFEGNTKFFDGNTTKNASLEIALFAPGDYFFNLSTASDDNGKFAVSYPISFAEPDGTWDIRITARDKDGNEGSTILKTKVSTPEGTVFYTVNILSPFKDAEFKRGSVVPITVEVKDEGRLLEGATVEFKDQHGEFLSLKEISPGIYSAEYKLHLHSHGDTWQMPTQALKTVDGITKAGGNRISIRIIPATLNLVLLQPTNFDFFAGQQITLQAQLQYSDGTPAERSTIKALLNNQSIALSEVEPGIYEAKYLVTPTETAAAGQEAFFSRKTETATMELSAEDVYGNIVTTPVAAVTIKQISRPELLVRRFYYDVVARYWYLFVSGFFFLLFVTYPLWHPYYLKVRLRKLTEAEKRIIEVQKDIQRKYFKHHSITREDYDKLMLKYRERASDLKENRLVLSTKLGRNEK